MTTDNELNSEPSLMRCWLKKSYLVSKKVGPWLGGFVLAIIAAYVIWLGATLQKAAEIWTVFTGWCGSASAILSNLVGSVPWPIWAALAVIGAIVGCSGAWCLARRFTYEDWQSNIAKSASYAFALALTLYVLALVLALALTLYVLALTLYALSLAVAFYAVLAALANLNPSSSAYFVGRFFGAYLHYRKRTKNFENKPCNKKD